MKMNLRFTGKQTYKLPFIFLLVLIDQCVKFYMRQQPLGKVLWRMPPIFELLPCQNTGAAYSVLSGHPYAILLLTVFVIGSLLIAVRRYMNLTEAADFWLSLLLAGAIGNMIDRLIFGYVTDYIRLLFISFPVFNLADILITLSVFAMIILLFTDKLEIHQMTTEKKHGSDT